jgi:hypothetical protein
MRLTLSFLIEITYFDKKFYQFTSIMKYYLKSRKQICNHILEYHLNKYIYNSSKKK